MAMTWFEVLEAARRVGSKREKEGSASFLAAVPFTAAQLAAAARFRATEHSSATDIAAGWISKLVRWGYARRLGPSESARAAAADGGRPAQSYELTKWGLSKKRPKTSHADEYPPRQKSAVPDVAKPKRQRKAAANEDES